MRRRHDLHRLHGAVHHPGRGILLGLTVVGAGLLLLLDNLHVASLPLFNTFWPLALVLWGVSKLLWPRRPGSWLIGVLLMAGGVLVTAQHLGYIEAEVRDWWPVLVIVAGLSILLGGRVGRRAALPEGFGPSTLAPGDHVDIRASFSAVHQRIDSRTFKGGVIDVSFGGVELDLRQAAMDGPEAVLTMAARFSGIELRVPRDWLVVVQVSPTLGGVVDQTVPPMNPTQRLVLRGEAMCGGIEISH